MEQKPNEGHMDVCMKGHWQNLMPLMPRKKHMCWTISK